jgi:hypothetical protein
MIETVVTLAVIIAAIIVVVMLCYFQYDKTPED